MPNTINNRIRELAARALALANNDIAAVARLLCEWSGLSLEFALMAVEEVVMFEEPTERDKDSEAPP
jgi:hypothetical protein